MELRFPFRIRDVFEVANGKEPDHTTGNCIRALLEAVGRFCWPDKSDSLSNFVTFLAGHDNLSIKSIMINNLSHGTYIDETPSPDDLKLACEETLAVFELYAPGQVALVKKGLS